MNIVIAGGGTAGWLSALFVSKIFPEHNVTVIENEQIGVIGTGEGSTGLLKAVINNQIFNFGCNEADFLRATGSFPKLGIQFTNWNKPEFISPIDGSIFQDRAIDILSYYAIANDIPAHLTGHQGYRIDANTLPYHDKQLNSSIGMAYHFDGIKVSKYFKSICATVKVMDDKILDVIQDEQGNVTHLQLTDKQVACDLVIDCLGFNSLISKKLDKGWVSYKKHLPVNCAIPFQIKNTDPLNTKLTTESRAMDYGWMWKIPVGGRYGCGYVFDKNHINEDRAIAEVEKTLGHAIEPIKVINFESGRQAELWKKNVVSIGLSSGFLEPLQATAIHTVIAHLQLLCFSFIIDKDSINNKGAHSIYNTKASKFFDDFADFINLHYQCGRTDTDFWRYMKYESATDRVKTVMELAKTRLLGPRDFDLYKNAAGNSLWNPIIIELGLISKDRAKVLLDFYKPKFSEDIDRILRELRQYNSTQSNISMKEFLETFNPLALG